MWPAPSHPIPKEEPVADYVAYFGGQWLPFSEVKIDPMDRGFLVGDCVFDVARTFNGKSFRMKAHVDRLYRSLKFVRIDPGLSPEEMERISEEVISRNEHLRADVGDYQIWQFVTRGRGRWAHKAGPPAVGVCTRQIGFSRFAHLYSAGAHGVIVRTHSFSSDALDPKVKHFSRMNFNLAELEAGDVDPEGWPILTDGRGHITEGVGYNVFIVTGGVIRTAGDRGILQGVSRAMVLRGVLHEHESLRPARDPGGPTPDRCGHPRPGRPAAPRHVERDRRRGHRGAGRAVRAARADRVQGRLLARIIRERARARLSV
jgi:branched-chain amino acid aminotransferase